MTSLIGFGISNCELLKVLLKRNEKVFVSETRTFTEDEREYFKENRVEYEEKGNTERILEADKIIVSPAVRSGNKLIEKARAMGKYVDVELSFSLSKVDWNPKVIAVTGTNGKTTTVSMIKHAVSKKYSCWSGGNIGNPLATLLYENDKKPEFLVLEVSSFQLHWSKYFKPNIAVILNIEQNHLDWHKNFDEYAHDKFKISFDQGENDVLIYRSNLEEYISRWKPIKSRKRQFDGKGLVVPEKFSTAQNKENYMAVCSVLEEVGYNDDEIKESLKDFSFLSHRMEFVAEKSGVKYYDDSKATCSAAVEKALENFTGNVILILAGIGKNEDYTRFSNNISRKVKYILASGPIGNDVEKYFMGRNFKKFNNLVDTMKYASKIALPGDTVLLSPAGSSFDNYKSYAERGNHFKSMVKLLK